MAKNLVIVESPAKVKTIKKFLGSSYQVMASEGHVRDLPKSQLGIDIENDYEPKYITIRGKGDVLAALRKEAKKSGKIYLATDPDREGEAISWHLAAALNLSEEDIHRITFNEITKSAVKASLKNPRKIDMNLVNAQQARREMDRMVGYEISPVLWAKVKRGLSAGRVQSAALRMICDREEEISAFIPEEYWTLDAVLALPDGKTLDAHFAGREHEKMQLTSGEQAAQVIKSCSGQKFAVSSAGEHDRTRKAPLPYTTSTLQQDAANLLSFSTQKTMRIAQQLYEGVEIAGEGTTALITYLRTDSTRISDEADSTVREYIRENYGDENLSAAGPAKTSGAHIQDAHEAIRPTAVERTPSSVKDSLSRDQFRLYQMIWKRFTASRMSDAVYRVSQVKLTAGGYLFTASASRLVHAGFLSVYNPQDSAAGENENVAGITAGMEFPLSSWDKKQHFTEPPAHYTEASLVRAMEEKGIGRPSTYAPTISVIMQRHYVTKEKKNLYTTELGEVVNGIMKRSFPQIVDVGFTANMESLLDMVSEGKLEWKEIVRNFYPDLKKEVDRANAELERVTVQDEVTDVICENCGRHMVIKYGPHGKFLACPGFPECRNTKPYFEKIGVKCPKCGKDVVIRRTRKGRVYYGCENNPACDFMSWNRPVDKRCPVCGNYMVVKGSRIVCSDPECGYSEKHSEKTEI